MQIELIGCTSAGKSTLAQSIIQACNEQGLNVLLGDDFVLDQVRLNGIKSHLPRTLLVDLMALFACLITWRNNREFRQFVTQLLLRLPIARLEKLHLLRNVLKKIGIDEIIRRRSTDQQIVLLDEGLLHAAHNLFVHLSVDVEMEHLATFARLVPMPDIVVYLRQPESLLIDRTMKRGHRRIRERSQNNVVRFIKQAVKTFDQLVHIPTVESKLLVVDGGRDVTIIAHCQVDPLFDLALRIIKSGMSVDVTHTSIEATPGSSLHRREQDDKRTEATHYPFG